MIGALGIVALFALILLQVPIGFAMMTVGVVGFALQGGGWIARLLVSSPRSRLTCSQARILPPCRCSFSWAYSRAWPVSPRTFTAPPRLSSGIAAAGLPTPPSAARRRSARSADRAPRPRRRSPRWRCRRCWTAAIRPRFSTGMIAAGGTLKSLIPPSLVMIIYCVVAKTFILDMFVAAIVPALITIALNLARNRRCRPAPAGGRAGQSAHGVAGAA